VTIQRPSWLPAYLPELDGLRGLAILGVVIYHSKPHLQGSWFYQPSLWGWSGVLLFFAMSGFLITAGLLEARDRANYFHNFHAKRALRIFPLYFATILVCYALTPWLIGEGDWRNWSAVWTAPWLGYLFFVQNLIHVTLPPSLAPTWALAIEEQYYFVWAPIVRWLRRPWMLALVLIAALVGSPLCRHLHPHWLTPTHTLIKLDSIALGSLLALAMYTVRLSRRAWTAIGFVMIVIGFWAAATFAGGTYLLDSALAVFFTGILLAAISTSGARTPINAALGRGPVAFYGRISYGVYLTHIAVFIFFGWVDLNLKDRGLAANLFIVVFHLVTSTLAAWAIFRWFETPILRLKKRYTAR
jgi:peptidoglycan/LPS O-acetylase OafA/YrhL